MARRIIINVFILVVIGYMLIYLQVEFNALHNELSDLYRDNAYMSHEIADLREEIANRDKYIVVGTKTAETTAYCPCAKCCGKCDGITATGTQATAGRTIAVDPSVYPYGTKIMIDGKIYTAEDCGGAIKGDKIDIFFDSHEEAIQYGRTTKEILILKEATNEQM